MFRIRTGEAPMIGGYFGRLGIAGSFAVLLALCACAHHQAIQSASLYDRLGGKPAITAVVDQFVTNVAGDKRINAFFADADIPHLKMELVDQICQASGGPCTYTGRDM